MILEEFNHLKTEYGVIKISEVDDVFENLYLKVRKKEKRIYSDDEIKLLPYASELNPHKDEWALRTKSYLRFREYLSHKTSKLNILDLGCGNGWFTGQLSKDFNHNYFGVDINLNELEQAARVFNNDNTRFIYADIFSTSLPANTFDVVIINSALQYFQNISVLMKELFYISKPYADIHIIDTPFYKQQELMHAKARTLRHYQSLGFTEMAKNYYHHSIDEIKYLRHSYLYNPNSVKNKLTNLFFEKDSPFPWILVTR
jgi:ubiquinone/menaquinone biosynthesis C-methylase UbiE